MDSGLKKQIRVLLVEDNAKFRKSLKLLIEADGDIQVVDEAKDGLEAVHLAKSLKPDVIVMDIALPLLNGLQATEKIMAASLGIRVLMLSAHPDPEYIHQAISFGASGYLFKQSSTQFLSEAIREVQRGNSYFSASISKDLRIEYQVQFLKGEALKKKAA
jgi:DNA-binding NarL/FixJ family response regulator